MKRLQLLLAAMLFCVIPLAGQGFFSSTSLVTGFPDAADLRVRLRSSITASTWSSRRLPTEVYTSESSGGRVRFQVRTQSDAFYLLLTNQQEGLYPLYSAGSYIIKRSLEDGRFIQAKIFLKSNADCFVRLSPFGERSKIEIYLYGLLIYREVIVPVSFEELLFSPFSRLVYLTERRVDWSILLPPSAPAPSALPHMINILREQVALLPDMDDGAMDAQGRFVYIESGERSQAAGGFNCSGFVKYVADGLYLPEHGTLLPLDPLKLKHPDLRGDPWSLRYEDERDPFFGLDWIRNIAAFMESGEVTPRNYEKHDVRHSPYSTYIEDVGYPVRELEAVLYLEALMNPGNILLASVNADYGTEPVLRQHIHVAVLLPYLTSRGELVTAVFERNRETSVESLLKRYPHEHIQLVRIPGSDNFRLPGVGP